MESYLAAVGRDAELMAVAAAAAGDDHVVPACPDWTVRDLLTHQGQVHRWATAHLVERPAQLLPYPPEPGLSGPELRAWLVAGAEGFVAAAAAAPADLQAPTFLRTAPTPLLFWARRQAHETAIHRVDAQQAAGRPVDSFDAAFAADGVDELLTGFISRRRNAVQSDQPRVLGLYADDADARWTVSLGPDGSRAAGATDLTAADCVVRGAAADLYLALWNRTDFATLHVTGEPALVDEWRAKAIVT